MTKTFTKNWGPGFREVSNLMGLKSVATKANEARLTAEVTAADGTHGYGRHGAQTGWEQQLIRAATSVTPDQSHDPMGVGPTQRTWNGVMALSHDDGAPVFDLFGDHGGEPTDYRTAAGAVAGGFATPEAQFIARAKGDQVVARMTGPAHYCARYRFKTENRYVRIPLTSVVVVVEDSRPTGFFGVGFARRDPRTYARHSRDTVVKLIDGFAKQKTWGEIYPDVDLSVHKFNQVVLKKSKVAFPSFTDLTEYLDLDVMWQPTCRLIYRRTHVPATNSHGGWRLITMFPDNDPAGWAPSLWLSPQQKTALKLAGFNKNANDYHWTGMTTDVAGTGRLTHTIPGWA